MASSTIPSNPQASNVGALLPKLHDADSDLRYMALNDLFQMFNLAHPNFLSTDFSIAAKTVDGLLGALNDTNGEVQNMALKCLGPFVTKIPENVLCPLIDKASIIKTDPSVDSSIPALALREIVVGLPRPTPGASRAKGTLDAYAAISKTLIPRLVGYHVVAQPQKNSTSMPPGMLRKDIDEGTDSNAIDVLTEVARCFGSALQKEEVEALLGVSFDIVQAEKSGSVIKKKSVIAIATLAPYFSDSLLSAFISRLIEHLRDPHLTHGKRRIYITILGSLARSIPKKFGPYLKTLAQFVFTALGDEGLDRGMDSDDEDERDPEIDDVREAALVAIEAFLTTCSGEMRQFTDQVIDAGTRFIKYDPNLRHDDDGDDEMEASAEDAEFEDEDFEEEAGPDDEDDSSWKVRRCAAKMLHTFISTRSGDLIPDGTFYEQIAPALVTRFKESDESVRLEIVGCLTTLVQNTRDDAGTSAFDPRRDSTNGLMGPPPSRKRRRGGSDASMIDSHSLESVSAGYASPAPASPPTGSRASLSKISQEIVRGVVQLLKSGTLSNKQAVVVLLRELVETQRGGLGDYLDQIVGPVVDAIKATGIQSSHSSGVSTSATVNSLRMEALRLLGVIFDFHSSKLLQAYIKNVVPVVMTGAQEKYSKVAVESLNTSEQIIKALTPPRAASQEQQNQVYLEQMYEVLAQRTATKDVDSEVRRRAVHVLGLLVARTSGSPSLLSPSKRASALDQLLTRLKNELTRLATVRSIDVIGAHVQDPNDLSPSWVRDVCLELGSQLRKSSRSLRGSSLSALRTLTSSAVCRGHLDEATVREIIAMLLPILSGQDLHLLGPALAVLATLIKDNGAKYVTTELNKAIGSVVTHSISGFSVDALFLVVKAIGEQGAGKPLMQELLSVGVSGNPDLVGKAIGVLLVYGAKADLGVKLEQFVQELSFADGRRQALAVTVLGEAGMQLGTKSPLTPDQFMSCFKSQFSQVPLAAAVAMGRAGSSHTKVFLPSILSAIGQQSSPQYLLMHSIKEILQRREVEADVLPYAQTLWQNLVAASQVEDNRAIGAECIGRLAIIDPKNYLSQLQGMLKDKKPGVRGMATAALRYTLADTDETYDQNLKPIVVDMLTTMLNESDLENRRLGLTTFNSAMHNKPELILPHLGELLPLAMRETILRPELIREVQMGPFKHKVDDGLEIRKSAYETLYALLESAFNRINIPDFFDRIVAGVGDEHDIRILCNLMLTKLISLAPEETTSNLGPLAERFRAVLSVKPKDNAVKQELEKMQESSKGVLKVSILLDKTLAADLPPESPASKAWSEYFTWVQREHQPLLKVADDEMKEKDR